MKYVGLYTQQRNNNIKSILLLLFFPTLILGLTAAFCFIVASGHDSYYEDTTEIGLNMFVQILPWVVGILGIWFTIAYFYNTAMIRHATKAKPLERKQNPRVYNIVENLTMTCGMPMPQVNIIDTPELNAFASGIGESSYTVTVTTGICNKLNDEELAGVIGHELTHIRNKDTRLLIVSIVFVGILSVIMSLAIRFAWNTFLFGGRGRRGGKNSGGGIVVALLLIAVLAAIGYFFSLITRFAISRKREYMADAGGAELCGNPLALASALKKISHKPYSAKKGRDDVQQLFIIHPQKLKDDGFGNWFSSLFSTHPSTESRIEYLEQF